MKELIVKFPHPLTYLDLNSRPDLDDAVLCRIVQQQQQLEVLAVAGTGAGGLTFMMLGQRPSQQPRQTSLTNGQRCLTSSVSSDSGMSKGNGSSSMDRAGESNVSQSGVVSLTVLTSSYCSQSLIGSKLRRLDLSGCLALQSSKATAPVFNILRNALGRLVNLEGEDGG